MRRPQFSLKTLLWLMVVVPPAFAFGLAEGRKVEQDALKADRARVVQRDLELNDKKTALDDYARELWQRYGAHEMASMKRERPDIESNGRGSKRVTA